MNWLCCLIGHKWITHTRGHKAGQPVKWQQVWPCCVRCGEPSPGVLSDAADDLAEMMAYELGREWRRAETSEKGTDNGKA